MHYLFKFSFPIYKRYKSNILCLSSKLRQQAIWEVTIQKNYFFQNLYLVGDADVFESLSFFISDIRSSINCLMYFTAFSLASLSVGSMIKL